jgi:oligopeptide transport system substrate-binding protein
VTTLHMNHFFSTPRRHCKTLQRWCALLIACTLMSTPTLAADANKTLRLAFQIAETSFDSAFASDEASQSITERIFEPMLEYDYLARPVKLVPRTLESMPVISDNGATFVFKIKQGTFFTDDPAFKGKPRELSATDYAYSLKRLLDPKVKSPWQFLVDGKLLGGDELRAEAVKSGKFDYDKPIAGLEIVDRYTLKIKLRTTDFNFAYILAMPSTGAIAREVVEAYGQEIGSHPIGTGPYVLARDEYRRASKMVLVANPNYRKRTWDWMSDAKEDQAFITAMKGKSVPTIGRVEISVIEEEQALWLSFISGQHDYVADLPLNASKEAKVGPTLKPEYAAKGIALVPKQTPNLYYTLFNMTHPTYGGYTPEKIALRRAIQLAFPLDEMIRVLYHGDGIPAKSIVPPNAAGHLASRARTHQYDPELARALLDQFGYKDRNGDGFRDMPDGSPLVIDRVSGPILLARQVDELWKRSMDAIGIKMTFDQQKTVDRRKAAREGKARFVNEAWNADYPDAENFFQLLYGGNGNAGGENYARFSLKEFDTRYEKMRLLPNGPERNRIINEMEDLVKYYAPWINTWHDVQYYVMQPWFVGFKKHPIAHDPWEYADIDVTKQPKQ